MSRSTDPSRELLFGLLALQTGMIDQGALFAAFAAWTRDKSKSMGDYLIALGSLDPDDRVAIDVMANRHLKKHGGEIEKSLAILAVNRSTQENLARIGGPDALTTLGHVGTAHPSTHVEDEDPERTATYSVGSATSEGKTKKSEAETKAVLGFFKEKVLAAARPLGQEGGLGKGVTLRAAIDAAERAIGELFAGQPSVEASIRDTLGQSYYYEGATDLAIRQYERALALERRVYGPSEPEPLETMNNLGMAYLDTGRLADALALFEEAAKTSQARIGLDQTLTLVSMGNLAHAYTEAGRLADALPLQEETLKRLEAQFGPDHMYTLTAMNNLANAYRTAGRLGEALPLFEQTLNRLRKTIGPRHPSTLLAMNNLALAYRDSDRLADAIPLHEEALKLSRAQLEPDHPDVLFAMSCLADAYRRAGRFVEAESLDRDTLNRRQAKLGPTDPSTLQSTNSLAEDLLDVKPAEAELLLRQSMAVRDKKLPDDWHTSDTFSLLGASLLYQKRYVEAEPLVIEGYEAMKAREAKIPPNSKTRLSKAGARIVQLYEAWGKKEKADEWRKRLAPTFGAAKPKP